jgi:hypothetical protein
MALQISNIAAVLKKVIVPVIQNQLPKESVFFDKVKKNSGVTIANNQIYIAARTGRHSGIYTVAEGTEPYAGKAKYLQPYTSMKYAFGTLELSDQVLEAAGQSNQSVKAIASILNTEITALKEDFRKDINRQMMGDGNGVLCLANGTGIASTALVVDTNPNGGDATEYLAEGMYIVVDTNSAVAIASVDSATGITLASAISWPDDSKVYKAGTAEIMGLNGIIDDGTNVATIQNMLRSSYPFANANVDHSAATLTEAQMIAQYLKAKRYGGSKTIFTGPTLFQYYGSLLTSMKRTANLSEVLKGGWKGLEFMDGVGVMLDFDTWSGCMHMVDFNDLTIAEMSDPFAWLEADTHGGILKRSASNRTVWEGTLKYYFNLVALKFKGMATLRNKTNAG